MRLTVITAKPWRVSSRGSFASGTHGKWSDSKVAPRRGACQIGKVVGVVGDAVLCQERKYFFLKALHLMVLFLAVKVAFHRFQIIMPNGECEVPVLPRERR